MRSSLAPVTMRAAARASVADPQFGQPHRFGSPVVDVVELRVGGTVPPIEDLIERGERSGIHRVRRVQRSDEAVGVEIDRLRRQPVTAARRLDNVGGQAATQPEQVVVQRRHRVARWATGPEDVNCRVDRDDVTATEDEQRQQATLQWPVRRDVAAVGHVRPDRAQHLDAQPFVATHHDLCWRTSLGSGGHDGTRTRDLQRVMAAALLHRTTHHGTTKVLDQAFTTQNGGGTRTGHEWWSRRLRFRASIESDAPTWSSRDGRPTPVS